MTGKKRGDIEKAQKVQSVRRDALAKLEWEYDAGLHPVTGYSSVDNQLLHLVMMDHLSAKIDLGDKDLAMVTGGSFSPEWLAQRRAAVERLDTAKAALNRLLEEMVAGD